MSTLQVKSGFITSEFWMALVPTVVSLLVLTGIVTPDDTEYITSLVGEIVSGIVAVIAVVSYIISRTSIKNSQIKMDTLLQSKESENIIG